MTQLKPKPESAKTLPLKLLTSAMIFTMLIILCLGIYMLADYRTVFTKGTDNLNLLKLNSLIMYYDEVLTMSVHMAAVTGDIEWEQRYEENEPRLIKAIQDIFKVESDPSILNYVSETELAYKNLIKMDRLAFDLIRQGRAEDALDLLFSEIYQNQKKLNSERIDRTLLTMQSITHAYQSEHHYINYIISICILISIPGLMLIWIGIVRIIKDHINRRRFAENALQIANDELEQRVLDRTNELTKMNISLLDEIDIRHQVELKLQKLSHAVEQSPNVVIITDTNGTIEYVNPRFSEVTGYSSDEVIGENPRLLKSGESTEEHYEDLWNTITSGGIWRGEFHNRKKNGKLYWGFTSISGIKNEKSEISHYVGIQEDITQRKLTQESLLKSEQQYRSIFESFQDVYYRTDAEGRIKIVSPSISNYGYDPEKLIGVNVTEFYPDPNTLSLLMKKLIIHDKVEDYELSLVDASGSTIKSSLNAKLIYNEKGEPIEIEGVLRDVTERHRAMESIKEREEQFRALTTAASDAIIMIDNDGKITFWNDAARRIFGYERDSVLGNEIHKLICPDRYFDIMQVGFERFRKTGKGSVLGRTVELIGRHKDGKEFPVELSLSAVKLQGKWNAIGVVRDISERKMAEKELISAKEAAEAGNRAKSSFLANMSHEIRTPMNAILGFSGLLTEQIEDKKHQEYLSVVSSSGKSLLRIVDDILDLSKIEAGMLEIQHNVVNPHHLFVEIMQMFSWKIKEQGLNFILDVDPMLPEGLLLDEVRMRQVIVNLVGNALKFTHHGHIKLSAAKEYISKDTSKLNLIFSVEDTGIGIPANQIHDIFKAFKQQADQSTSKYGGTGLGLAISKRLVEMMGGKIEVESEIGKGSCFKFRLHNVEVAAIIDSEVDQAAGSLEFIKFDNPTILIVDDEDTSTFLVKEYLQPHNVNFIEASNGREAIILTETHHPDLIIMDIKMPVMNGQEATRQILTKFSDWNIPIIALTASVMSRDEEKVIAVGFAGYLRKPANKSQLITELMKHLPFKNLRKDFVKQETLVKADLKREDFTEDVLLRLPELNQILKNDYLVACHELQNTLIINEAKEFAEKISALGTDFQFSQLNDWANELNLSIDTFNIGGISEKLERFPEIIEIINSLLAESSK